MQDKMISRAKELLLDGTVNRVLGWKTGEFEYDITPAVFTTAQELENDFVYNSFAAANLSKYLVKESRKEGKILVFLKPCDSYSFQELMKEHRVIRENVYIIGIACYGKTDIEKIKEKGISGISSVGEDDTNIVVDTIYDGTVKFPKYEVMAERCLSCKSKKVVIYDELIGENGEVNEDCNRFDLVAKLEAMTPDERFAFWQNELSKCMQKCLPCLHM